MRRNIQEMTPSFMFKFNKKSLTIHPYLVLAYLNGSINLSLCAAIVCGNDEINQTAVELITTLQPI
jgi:hypothetical protein